MTAQTIDPNLDLILERVIDVTPDLVWKAWTTPELIKKWFTPAPWKTSDCKLELKAGGVFNTIMQSPEGETFPNDGCILEVVDKKRLVFTSALKPGFRPVPTPPPGAGFHFTAKILIEASGRGTKYTAIVMHSSPEDQKQHEAMGFHDGWGKALDQLVATVKAL